MAEKISAKPNKKYLAVIVFVLFALMFIFYYFFIRPPVDFPSNAIYSVEENRALSEIASDARKNHLIKSALAFKILTALFSGNKGIISGDYVLHKKENVFQIAQRFAKGDYRLSVVKVTIPEGFNIYEIAELLSEKDELRNFNQQEFIRLAENKEGYLYPDTYYFLPNVKAKQIIDTMEKNFTKKIAPIQKDINKFGRPFKEILTMASILEKEVRTDDDRRIVAGIFWKRIKMRMPLQVDAVFRYINPRKEGVINRDDLKIDSPYNTYLNKGLPPGPISNPSLDAIIAAINPKETKYLYYLSDKKGVTHFAGTLEEHNNNVNRYLR
ncbi:MAG: endolytic transglycosylase MltG [Patescibacteria group bacterium]|nr:endolytic transglycosylase MltG [Patescibacteria group bacterium]MDE2218169.1 endolytic transglycosylase MltG [Patescibacteria group bacterium]